MFVDEIKMLKCAVDMSSFKHLVKDRFHDDYNQFSRYYITLFPIIAIY